METEATKLWFRAKKYGWGWTPVTWQGWIVTVIFIALVVSTRWFYDVLPLDMWERDVLFVVSLAGHTMLLLSICLWKGESPRWRWGD